MSFIQHAESLSPPSPTNRLSEIREKLQLPATLIEEHLATTLEDEDVEVEEDTTSNQLDKPLLPPSLKEMTFTDDDDRTLTDLLSSLHSTKVCRMHKYTDEQLTFMHKHNVKEIHKWFGRVKLMKVVDLTIHSKQFQMV